MILVTQVNINSEDVNAVIPCFQSSPMVAGLQSTGVSWRQNGWADSFLLRTRVRQTWKVLRSSTCQCDRFDRMDLDLHKYDNGSGTGLDGLGTFGTQTAQVY